MRAVNVTALDGADGTVPQNSAPISARMLTRAGVVFVIAGATGPVANLALRGSNDVAPAGNLAVDFVPENWVDIEATAITDNGTFEVAPQDLCYEWIKVTYVITEGTGGTVTAKVHGIGWP